MRGVQAMSDVELKWVAPTENVDGTPLNLAGFTLYYGSASREYSQSVTIDNPGITSYVIENLTPGTYEFVATSVNNAGEESRYSLPATMTVTSP